MVLRSAARGARRQSAALAAALLSAAALGGCSHAVSPAIEFDQAPRFDFRQPGCRPGGRPAEVGADDVLVRYLGAGGLYVEWRGEGLLTGPFFSNPDLVEVATGRIRTRRGEIVRGLRGVPVARVGAILVGHSHYDHLGDVPFVAERFARRARIYVNDWGRRVLDGIPGLDDRVDSVQENAADGGAIHLRDAARRPLPFRVHPVPSHHAPHAGPLRLMTGEAEPKRRAWDRRRYRNLREGRPHAFVIDLLAEAAPGAPALFRIHYQDSASAADEEPAGIPAPDLPGPDYDLAVVCMASAHLVRPYPAGLLASVTPRHVVVTHYEDFFRPRDATLRFVPLLTEDRANRFLERTDRALRDGPQTLSRPVSRACGATAEGWTMPRVGEWLVFRRSTGEGKGDTTDPR